MKYVYDFSEGNKDMRDTLGGKGANMAEMKSLGLSVPDGFTVSTVACNNYYENNKTISTELEDEILMHLNKLEERTGKKFGGSHNPLLVSVRSGSPISMPGMMDTILNLGINDDVVNALIRKTNNERFAYDSYRRFIEMYADVVKECSKDIFEKYLDDYKQSKNYKSDLDLNEYDLKQITEEFKRIYFMNVHEMFPTDPKIQLMEAVKAVFRSWNNERAIYYRKMNNISDTLGTAVNIQEMVYGNSGLNSGTGVAFSRNPATGENEIYGEYLINAQGEDVVAGIRTPYNMEDMKIKNPNIYAEFLKNAKILEEHYRDMQDMEFTFENDKLYMLQTRNGKRTAKAALKIALDLYEEGLITDDEMIMRIEPEEVSNLLHPSFDKNKLNEAKSIGKGLAASPGAASGKIYLDAKSATEASKNGESTILVRLETSPEDIEGMHYASGILTVRGGMTSHAAVVARGMGRCCISGASDVSIDIDKKTIKIGDYNFKEGDYISLDGDTGLIYQGIIETNAATITGDFKKFMDIVDSKRKLGVRANADTVDDAKKALELGAEGIGLCRTEHMFFDKEKIFAMRQMIVAESEMQRNIALNKLLPMQRNDFEGLFTIMDGKTVTIRYLDPPLHEFLPKTEDEITDLANSLHMRYESLKKRIDELKEFNPMMGHRGCRLDVTYPEIAIMQTRAVIEAAINVQKKNIVVNPEIMIPLIGSTDEYKYVKDIVEKTAKLVIEEKGVNVNYKIGTMIEVPRACLIASDLALESDFFSFGTNDLTQLTYGFSRDDAGKFLKDYYENKIMDFDPFARIDEEGVGTLVSVASSQAKIFNPNIHLGICGEHAGEEKSIAFFNKVGLDYVSCSPYRVPIARLAAARANIESK